MVLDGKSSHKYSVNEGNPQGASILGAFVTINWGRNLLVKFNAGKAQLISCDWSNNSGAIGVKMGGSVLQEKSSFKMLGLSLTSN